MKRLATPIALFFAMSSLSTFAADSPAPAPSLKELRWKARVILVSAPPTAKAELEEQRALWAAEAKEARKRDLVLVELIGGKEGAEIRRRFGIAANQFTVLLIGKDGGEKARAQVPTKPSAWFDLIDSMPMRRDEIRAARDR